MTARALFAACYPACGPARRIEKSSLPASNQHYRITAAGGRFFLKQLRAPDSLYEKRGLARLETLSRALLDLGAAGLPVERLVPAKGGKPLVVSGGSVFRLYEHIAGRGYSGSPRDLRLASQTLGRLHARGLKTLAPRTARKLKTFGVPYPLKQTLGKLDSLERFLTRDFDVIREAAHWVRPLITAKATALVHNDFHPGNVLYDKHGAIMIDFDNALIGPREKCAALSVIRFAFWRKKPSPAALERTLDRWNDGYGLSLKDPYRWMAYVELEKILRILERWRRTGEYGRFLPNIAGWHLPNLKMLVSLS